MRACALIVWGLIAGLALPGCERGGAPPPSPRVTSPEALTRHTREFERGVVEVTDGVYVAIGYGLANSILLEGDDGVIIVDTMENREQGQKVKQEFRKITKKPVRAIVYTHNHTDHVFGAQAFVDEGSSPEVFAHETTNHFIDRIITEFRPIIARRSFRMFGIYLNGPALENAGIGPFLGFDENSTISLLRPTRTFSDRMQAEVAGIRFELFHAPGETDDQIFLWIPERKILLSGDNLYKTFPNLYTIRGTPYRSLKSWAASLDRMRALRPEYLIPSHTRPIEGADEIQRVLTDYRDAIRFVYDQSVRGINQGLSPDELVEHVTLPPHLAASPYLQEFYGKVSWSVRSVFAGNLGWFDGNPSNLEPLSPDEHARRMARLAGGEAALKQAVLDAAAEGDHQWVLQLSDHALRLLPEDADLIDARVRALTALGEAEGNPNARHYYLTQALEESGALEIRPPRNVTDELLLSIPMSRFMEALAVNLDAEAAADLDQRVGFSFPDTQEEFTVWARRGVVELAPGLADELDLHVQIDSLVWKQILAETRNAALALATDVEMLKGGRVAFTRFLALFRPEG